MRSAFRRGIAFLFSLCSFWLGRFKEQLTSKWRGILTCPLGKHRAEGHGEIDFDVKRTTYGTDTSSRKELELFLIFATDPAVNCRDGCSSIEVKLSFISHCGQSGSDIRKNDAGILSV